MIYADMNIFGNMFARISENFEYLFCEAYMNKVDETLPKFVGNP